MKSDDLFLIYFNIRSLQKNFDYLCNYLFELKRSPDVIAVTETKLYDNAIHANIDIMGTHLFTAILLLGQEGLPYTSKTILTLISIRAFLANLPLLKTCG